MARYKVTMWLPQYTYVDAKDEDDAILVAEENGGWEAPYYQGGEKFDVEEIKKRGGANAHRKNKK